MTSTSPTGPILGRFLFQPGRFDLDDYIDYVIAICETLSKEHDGLSLHQAKPNLAEIWLIHRANRLTP